MPSKYIIKKDLAILPCRFVLGCIGHSRELSPKVNLEFLSATKNKFGTIEEILPAQDFPNPPESYFKEMGNQPLSTIMIILKYRGAYTDLHHLKRDAIKVEKQFSNPINGRTFNINPGAVGTHGICLVSHKSTGGRRDISTYAYGLHPHLLFGGSSYNERIMRWKEGKLELIEEIEKENKFPEYAEASRIARFEELVRTLPKSDVSVELFPPSSFINQ